MKHLSYLGALALFGAIPALSATTSAQLFSLSDRVAAASVRSYTLEKEGLTLLREPVLTYNGKALASYPSQYMGVNPETAWALTLPPGYYPSYMQMSATFTTATATKWSNVGPLYTIWEAGAGSNLSRGSAAYAAVLKAWAEQLKADGR